MDKELYLAFIDNVGTNLDEKYVYQFYFSETPEVVVNQSEEKNNDTKTL